MAKQLTRKRDDTPLHSAARAGNLELVLEVLTKTGDAELKKLLSKQNQAGETSLYVAAENGYVNLVAEMIKYYDTGSAGIKAKNGYDAFHVAARKGYIEVLKVLMDATPEYSITVNLSNTTALHTAAAQGHFSIARFLLEKGSSLATIARNNGKTFLHSAARKGHLEVVKALLRKEPGLTTRIDKKGQTALHMAVKGQNIEVVDELMESDHSLINMIDNKGNTALHTAIRKGHVQIVLMLLNLKETDTTTINKAGETALDTAEKIRHSEIVAILQKHGVQNAKSIPTSNTTRELKQTVRDIKDGVHNQLQHTWQTRRRVSDIKKHINKMHGEGLNNAINYTTIVAVLIATVTFAAIFIVPGQYADDPKHLPPNFSSGEANIAPKPQFIIFFIFDSIALFISLAVVVVQTSVVVIERESKKQLMAVMNKLMWLACVLVSAAFIALSYIVVGDHEKSLAIGVTGIGTVIMAATLGTMCYWVIMHRVESSKLRSNRRSSMSSRSPSRSMSVAVSDSEILTNEYKKVYAL